MKISLILFFFVLLYPYRSAALEGDWTEEKSQHFIILFSDEADSSWAKEVLRKAEIYYDKIGQQIGYFHFQQFWTWDERVQIIVYPDNESFMKATELPAWARAGAFRDYKVFSTRAIVTFLQEREFIDDILPHEISHLILRDFIGLDKNIPVWLDEGVAQLQSKDKDEKLDKILKPLVKSGQYIPLKKLIKMNIREEEDNYTVSLFYAQSLSVVDFMVKQNGSYPFGIFCRSLKDGKTLQEALRTAYPYTLPSINELEKKWLRYMKY